MKVTFTSEQAREVALGLARGKYQRGLLTGEESWHDTFATRGVAYNRSRESLRKRLLAEGFSVIVNCNYPFNATIGPLPTDYARLLEDEPESSEPIGCGGYLDPSHADAFVDFPEKLAKPDVRPDAAECPVCKGYGGWNLKLNAYPLHDYEDTPANRHRYAHFLASCSQCQGYGWTTDLACSHRFEQVGSVAMFQHINRCAKCGVEQVWDSSG